MRGDPDPTAHSGGDDQLIAAVRARDTAAYGLLYQRHVEAARRLARYLARNPADASDLVADAFARVLEALLAGRGPEVAFRPYLLATMRNLFYDRARRGARVAPTDDMAQLDAGVQLDDPAVAAEERSLVARAFARLPERQRAVLWHTEVEDAKPATVAPILGIAPNAVAALAYRARERLRQHYLQEHIAVAHAGKACSGTLERLGAHVRDGLSSRDRKQVEAHIGDCERCAEVHLELWDLNTRLKGLLAPALLGPAAAAGFTGPAAGAGGVAGILGQARRLSKLRSVRAGAATGAAVMMAAVAAAMVLTTGTSDDDPPDLAAPPATVEATVAASPAPAPSPSSSEPATGPASSPGGWEPEPSLPAPEPAGGLEAGGAEEPSPDSTGDAPGPQTPGGPPPAAPEPGDDPGAEEPPAGGPPPEEEPEPEDPCEDLYLLNLVDLLRCLLG